LMSFSCLGSMHKERLRTLSHIFESIGIIFDIAVSFLVRLLS